MIIDSVQRKYQVVLTAAKTTSDLSVVVNWEPVSKMPNLTPSLARTSTNGVTAVDILATTDLPKRINSLTIYNADTAAKTVQVFLNDTGTAFLIVSATIQPGETLGYSEATQWYTGGQIGPFALLNGNALEDFSAHRLIVGDPGAEGTGINIGGVTYESSFKVSDIDGTNFAQTILHRHSTTLEPLIVGARSNSDTSSHASVTTGQGLFSIYAAGWAGSNYKLFGSESFKVGTGTVSNTSSPGKWSLSITPDGSTTPVETHFVDSDGLLHGSVAPATAATHALQASQKPGFPINFNGNMQVAQAGTVFGTNTGTAGVTNGSPNVTGSGTDWLTSVKATLMFQAGGVYYTVLSVTSNTALVLTANYAGATNASIAYSIGNASTAYDHDGWQNTNVSTAVFTVAQVVGSIAGKYARQVTITTADASVAVGDSIQDRHALEGYDVANLVGKDFTVSFSAKFPVTGIHCVSLRNASLDRSYVHEINCLVANTYADYSFTVSGGLPTAGTWVYTNSASLYAQICHMAGTTYTGTPATADTWMTGDYRTTANQVNDCATIGNVWALEDFRIDLGTVKGTEWPSYPENLARCQRHARLWVLDFRTYAAAAASFVVSGDINMRATPTLSYTAAATASLNISGTPTLVGLSNGKIRATLVAAAAGDTYYTRDVLLESRL